MMKILGKPRGRHSAPPRGEYARVMHERRKGAAVLATPDKKQVGEEGVELGVEVIPAILRKSFENVVHDWERVYKHVNHVQIDVTDGVFAGDGTFREVKEFKKLPESEKIELHMMVHEPGKYVDDIVDLNPARVVFHIEAFSGADNLREIYQDIDARTSSELGLAINPDSNIDWLDEHLDLVNYVMFMGYNPGWAGQDIDPRVYEHMMQFKAKHPLMKIAVDGHVDKETVGDYVKSGARVLAANSSIFKAGDAIENTKQLQLLADASLR